MSAEHPEWRFFQVFGDKSPIEEVLDVDIVSALEFDDTGEYLAAGDRGGRVVVFERAKNAKKGTPGEYKFYAEFQSHEPEFDYLKSLEIEEKINKIKWLRRHNHSHFLLTTNDKTIKLWKIHEKRAKAAGNHVTKPANKGLVVPGASASETKVSATPRRLFQNAHAYHINSISLNSDGETYISSDDLRINLWNLEISDQSFNIVDIKPANMDELTEVITSAEFHPRQCNLLMYSSSKGTIKLGDLRSAALCDQHAKVFEEEEDPRNKSFFSEIISSISDIKFSSDGRFLVSRDYLTLKVWDVRMESKPVKTHHIHDNLKSKLCDLYENDCIFDKFECAFSGDGNLVLTGSYNNYFHIQDIAGKFHTTLEANKFATPKQARKASLGSKVKAKWKPGSSSPSGGRRGSGDYETNPDNLDFNKKILHVAWHPRESLVAVGASNNLFLFAAP